MRFLKGLLVSGAVALVGEAITLVAGRFGGRKSGTRKPHPGSFCLVIVWQVKPERKNAVVKEFKHLAKYCAKNEPGTLAYEIAEAQNDPCKLLVFERYTSVEYMNNVHKRSVEFNEFKTIMERLDPFVTKSGQGYFELDAGFM